MKMDHGCRLYTYEQPKCLTNKHAILSLLQNQLCLKALGQLKMFEMKHIMYYTRQWKDDNNNILSWLFEILHKAINWDSNVLKCCADVRALVNTDSLRWPHTCRHVQGSLFSQSSSAAVSTCADCAPDAVYTAWPKSCSWFRLICLFESLNNTCNGLDLCHEISCGTNPVRYMYVNCQLNLFTGPQIIPMSTSDKSVT